MGNLAYAQALNPKVCELGKIQYDPGGEGNDSISPNAEDSRQVHRGPKGNGPGDGLAKSQSEEVAPNEPVRRADRSPTRRRAPRG